MEFWKETLVITFARSEVPHIRTALRDVVLSHENLNIGLHRHEQTANIRLQQLSAEVAAARPSFEKLESSIQYIAANTSEKSQSISTLPGNMASRQGFKIYRRTSINKCCDALCICHCHRPVIMKSPLWMESLIGVIFITYFNIFKSHPCTERTCSQNEKSWFEINFCFPTWFLRRVLKVRDQWTFSGHMITIRTPRTIELGSSAFRLAQFGNVSGMQTLYSQGLSSPFDVDMTGLSPLMVSYFFKNIQVLRPIVVNLWRYR